MNTQEFFERCNQSVEDGTLLAHSKAMDVFGENVNDFDDNFGDSVESDLKGDFEDDFSASGFNRESTMEVNRQPDKDFSEAHNLGIRSVQLSVDDGGNDCTIEGEVRRFLLTHCAFSGVGNDLAKLWNHVYNDNLLSENDVFSKYLRVHYGLWFTDEQAFGEAFSIGLGFVRQLKFDFRMCSLSDIRFIRECWKKPWYDPDIINEFALDINFVPLLIELMENGKADIKIMARYRESQENLLCCLRLLNADRFILGEFDKAVHDGCAKQYTEAVLLMNGNRLQVIEHREDFDEIKVQIRALEGDGKLIDWDLVEKYKDAYHLGAIITALAEGRFNAIFADTYLLESLGKFSFISAMYSKNEVDVEIAPSNFMYSKICTDAGKLGLDIHRFEVYKRMRGLSCLVCSRYAGKLSETDYRKFLAILSLDAGTGAIESLNASERLVESYNLFWMSQLVRQLDLSLLLDSRVGDNILFIKFINNKKRKYYLQIDDFVINREKFQELVAGSISCEALKDGEGIALSNVFLNTNHHFRCKAKSSLTEWANGGFCEGLQGQNDDNFILHTNFWKALQNADRRVKLERSGNRKLSRTVLGFLEMDMSEYYNYDKMFNYVADHQEFLGIFMSQDAFSLLKLFSNAYVYNVVPQVMFMFLYVVLLKYCPDKMELYSEGFSGLDTNKSILIVDGLGVNNTVINFRTISDSIDNFISIALDSRKVILRVSERTINLQFLK